MVVCLGMLGIYSLLGVGSCDGMRTKVACVIRLCRKRLQRGNHHRCASVVCTGSEIVLLGTVLRGEHLCCFVWQEFCSYLSVVSSTYASTEHGPLGVMLMILLVVQGLQDVA